ncbi:MAG: methylmalonyl-CoA epimerase [Candidatus Poseidoniaceae archaeon]
MKQRITIDHVGIAALTLDQGSRFWELLGLVSSGDDEVVEDQGVITRFYPLASINDDTTKIEILEATEEDTPIGRFLAKRGPGIQQLCLAVDDLESMIEHLLENQIMMIDSTPRKGAHDSLIAFVHPKSTGGILVELKQR